MPRRGASPRQVSLFQGSCYVSKFFVCLLASMAVSACWAQSGPSCEINAVPPIVRSEGVTERVGDIIFNCTGAPNTEVAGNLAVQLNAPVTNRFTGNLLDVFVSRTASGSTTTLPLSPRLQSVGQVVFDDFRFTLDASGRVELRISNIRVDVTPLLGTTTSPQVVAQLAFNPPGVLNFTVNRLTVAFVDRGLYVTSLSRIVGAQIGSPVPETLTIAGAFNTGTAFSTSRVTEGFPTAFERRGAPNTDHGTRLVVRHVGLPAGSRIFAPAIIAGLNAQVPTSVGDFGVPASGGTYVPGSNTLLLVRVNNADANGAGGSLAAALPTGAAEFSAIQEVPVTGNTAVVVYEVVDSNPGVAESAHIPSFLAVPRVETAETPTIITRTVSFGPISNFPTASPTAPIPRFVGTAAPTDCNILRDCERFTPRLRVQAIRTTFEAPEGTPFVRGEVFFTNVGGGILSYRTSIEYANGAGWLKVFPEAGLGSPALDVFAYPTNLTPGVYNATIVLDAGDGGIERIPVRLTVTPRVTPAPAVTGVGNSATFTGAVVPGSLATIAGSNFATSGVSVTFNGRPATVLFSNATQINVQVPADLTGSSALLVVTANGTASTPINVNVATSAPGIFVPGILNENSSVNTAANPAQAGRVIQIFATGLLPASGAGTVEVQLHDRLNLVPEYAGPAPGLPGVQQVNVRVPSDLPTMTTDIALCSTVSGVRACSPKVRISLLAN